VSARDELLRASRSYAETFDQGGLERAPRRGIAILTCMDARIDPLRLFGLERGDAAILRNAGARVTDDVLRSLVVAYALLGVREVFVVGHTDCGLAGTTDEEIRAGLGEEAAGIEFLAFADLDESVRHGVARIEGSPLLDVAASGFVYDVATGALREV
jgi:carbonic anhydrase